MNYVSCLFCPQSTTSQSLQSHNESQVMHFFQSSFWYLRKRHLSVHFCLIGCALGSHFPWTSISFWISGSIFILLLHIFFYFWWSFVRILSKQLFPLGLHALFWTIGQNISVIIYVLWRVLECVLYNFGLWKPFWVSLVAFWSLGNLSNLSSMICVQCLIFN